MILLSKVEQAWADWTSSQSVAHDDEALRQSRRTPKGCWRQYSAEKPCNSFVHRFPACHRNQPVRRIFLCAGISAGLPHTFRFFKWTALEAMNSRIFSCPLLLALIILKSHVGGIRSHSFQNQERLGAAVLGERARKIQTKGGPAPVVDRSFTCLRHISDNPSLAQKYHLSRCQRAFAGSSPITIQASCGQGHGKTLSASSNPLSRLQTFMGICSRG